MEEVVRRDLLHNLSAASGALRAGDPSILHDLSNHTIHDASIFQDPDSISFAIVVYALGKLLERDRLNTRKFDKLLMQAKDALREPTTNSYRNRIDKILSEISKEDNQLKAYVDSVLTHAQLKKGTKIHEHGISLGKAAELLGVSQWDMMSYLGKTVMADMSEPKMEAKRRLNLAKKIFNI